MILQFLLLLHLLSSAQAALIPPPPSISITTSLHLLNQTTTHSPNLPPNNSTTALDGNKLIKSYCTAMPRWNHPVKERDDCEGVLAYFYYETMADGGKRPVEFLSPGAKKVMKMKGQATPRKYTFRTCTLAILMVKDIPLPAQLPGGYRTGPETDAASYATLNRAAVDLADKCVLGDGKAGWLVAGQNEGVGLFIWSTGSEEDQEVENEGARVGVPALGRVGNGSVAVS